MAASSSHQFQSITKHKHGGTATIAVGNITGRLSSKGDDPHGRWSYLVLQGAPNNTVCFISAYQCVKPTNSNGTASWHQQESAFIQEGRASTDPRKNFRVDLIAFLKHQQQRGHSIVLAGDFNEHITSNHASIKAISLQCHLVDTWKHKFPDTPEPVTYDRGSRRLDYILISPSLLPAVHTIGYEPFYRGFQSDHRAMFLDFDTNLLFGNTTNRLGSAQSRSFNSKQIHNCSKYVQAAYRHGQNQHLFSNLRRLLDSHGRNDALIETYDALLGACCDTGSNQCQKYRPTWFSTKLAQLRLRRQLLYKWRRAVIRHSSDPTFKEQLLQEIDTTDDPFHLPSSLSDIKINIRSLTQKIYDLIKKGRETREAELHQRVANLRADDKSSIAKIVNNIRRSECRAATFEKFAIYRGKHQKSGLQSVSIPASWPSPDEQGLEFCDTKDWDKHDRPFRTVTLPEEIEYYIMQRNRRHFGQAAGTPWPVLR